MSALIAGNPLLPSLVTALPGPKAKRLLRATMQWFRRVIPEVIRW